MIPGHNKIRDELLYLSQGAFTSASVRSKPLIHQGNTRSEQEICQGSYKDIETQGDVMIQGLWDRQVEAIIGAKRGDADADSYKYEPMAALLVQWKTIKKDQHDKHCHDQRKQISPFSLSVDGMLEGGNPWSYSRNLVKSWQRKGTNPFCKYVVGSTVESQLRLQGPDHA